jgi:hypothetical protein
MSLSGQLSDLSLAELIEFFCNQHKTGRLKISYPQGPGFFYFQNGSLVDAKIGILSGVEAVYFALTLDNAAFKFSNAFPPTRRTIHQPWTHVALEGLRRMDEGVQPQEAFPEGNTSYLNDPDYKEDKDDDTPVTVKPRVAKAAAGALSMNNSMPLSMMVGEASSSSRGWAVKIGVVAFAVVLLVAAAGIPAGWYNKKRQAAPAPTPVDTAPTTTQTMPEQQPQQPEQSEASPSATTPFDQTQDKKDEAGEVAKRALEKERERIEREKRKQQEAAKKAEANQQKPEQAKSGPKMVTVTVTYDESGRVVSASGSDPAALRIARQKRFPAGKGGVATVTIPVN